ARCRERFLAEPERWLAPAAPEPAPAPAPAPGRRWTCPMHPEIVRDAPGDCPLCGMALEPMEPSLEDAAESDELRDMTRRFRVSALFTLPLFVVAMGEMVPGLDFLSRVPGWVQLVLATPVVLWGGAPFFARGWASLRTRLNMFTLIALGTGAAYAYSVVAVLAPDVFPASFRAADGAVPVYF